MTLERILGDRKCVQMFRYQAYSNVHERHVVPRSSRSPCLTVTNCAACCKKILIAPFSSSYSSSSSLNSKVISVGLSASANDSSKDRINRVTSSVEEREPSNSEPSNPNTNVDVSASDEENSPSGSVRIALGLLWFYKNAISPLIPSSCRFLPTCSSYAVDAYTQYGFTKGTILTAWRCLRCNPWGGRGYDPVRWPPPGLEFLSKAEH